MNENQTKSGVNLPLIIGAAVGVAVVVVGAFLVLGRGGNNDATMAQAGSDAGGGASPADSAMVATEAYLAQTDAKGTDGGVGTGIYEWDFVDGDADAPITIVEYASWTCPFCRRFHENSYQNVIKPAIEAGQVKYIVRDFTRNNIDFRVALAARCEGIDFKAASDALYANQPFYSVNDMELVDQAVIQALSGEGMTPAKYVECLTNTESAKFVKHVSDQGQEIGVRATPTVYINGNKIDSSDFDDLQSFIDAELN